MPANSTRQTVLIPGAGAYYALTPTLGVLAGAYRGFSPAAPGLEDGAEPETSWNYEAGARFGNRRLRAEAIGFFNDYRNLISVCTLAGGCPEEQVDRQFNAGRATIWGFELFGQMSWQPARLASTCRSQLAYGFTRTRLASTFVSEDPQLGSVQAGDELPYVPHHQGALSAAARDRPLRLLAGRQLHQPHARAGRAGRLPAGLLHRRRPGDRGGRCGPMSGPTPTPTCTCAT